MSDCPLTPTQVFTLQGIADGLTCEQIALRAGRSVSAIRSRLSSAIQVLGVSNSTQAVLKSAQAGWIDAPMSDESDRRAQLERVVARLALATERLVDALLMRRGLTRTQARYLAAFDELLFARTMGERAEARSRMDRALGSVLADAQISIGQRQRREDLAGLLIRFGMRGLKT